MIVELAGNLPSKIYQNPPSGVPTTADHVEVSARKMPKGEVLKGGYGN